MKYKVFCVIIMCILFVTFFIACGRDYSSISNSALPSITEHIQVTSTTINPTITTINSAPPTNETEISYTGISETLTPEGMTPEVMPTTVETIYKIPQTDFYTSPPSGGSAAPSATPDMPWSVYVPESSTISLKDEKIRFSAMPVEVSPGVITFTATVDNPEIIIFRNPEGKETTTLKFKTVSSCYINAKAVGQATVTITAHTKRGTIVKTCVITVVE